MTSLSFSTATRPMAALAPIPTWRRGLRRVLGHRGLALGGILLAAVFAPWLSPHDPYAQDVTQRLIPPFWNAKGSWEHILGTDKLGRDYLSRLLFGARVSLEIGVVTALVAGLIGTTLGVLAGYFGGRVDAVVSYIITTRLAMPVVLVALATASLVGGSLQVVIILLGSLLWDRFAIVTRSAAQQLRDAEFIAAAKALGASTPYILLRELLPNVLLPLAAFFLLGVAVIIVVEGSLSFLGLGVPPPISSWGSMIGEGRESLEVAPRLAFLPAAAMFLTVLAFNLVGDTLRALTDPRQGAL